MDDLRTKILKEIKKRESLPDTIEELDSRVFHSSTGMRLTAYGYRRLENYFTSYKYELANRLLSRHLINLQKLTFPYYFWGKSLIIFSEVDNSFILLCGSLEQFLES